MRAIREAVTSDPPPVRGACDEPAPEKFLGVSGEIAEQRYRSVVWRFVRWAASILLFVLFLVGLVTPIMPQIPFLVASLLLVAPDFPPARRLVVRLERKFPSVRRRIPKRWRRTKHGP